MASIIRTDCAVGVYTLISDGNDKATFTVPSNLGGRMAMGATQPAASAPHYRDCLAGETIELGSLGTTKIWYMPNAVAQSIAVIVG